MHPFPPPAPFLETPSAPYMLGLLLCLIMSLATAVMLLRDQRKAKAYDTVLWIVAGLIMTGIYYGLSMNALDHQRSIILMIWMGVTFGGWVSWAKKGSPERPSSSRLHLLVLFVPVVIGLALANNPGTSRRRIPQCPLNLRDIAIALHGYHEDYDSFPPQTGGEPPASWRVAILPYLDHDDLHAGYDFAANWDTPGNQNIAREPVKEYTCPAVHSGFQDRDGLRFTSYAAPAGEHTFWQGDRPVGLDFARDGSAYSILVVEACGQQIVWTEPRDMELDRTPVGFNLPGIKSRAVTQPVFELSHRRSPCRIRRWTFAVSERRHRSESSGSPDDG